jgi:hypothetical protein
MDTTTIISFILQTILFYLVFNVFVVGIMIYRQNASKAALNWPSVQGKIKSSRVHRRDIYSTGGDGHPWVEYTYDVNGKTYKSMTISVGGLIMDDQKQAENMVARYPKGADVPVYYNPSDPSKACLEKKPVGQAQLWGALIVGNLAMPFIVLLFRLVAHQ